MPVDDALATRCERSPIAFRGSIPSDPRACAKKNAGARDCIVSIFDTVAGRYN